MLDTKGNGWQLVESFPWLAVRIFTDEANESRHLVRRGAKMRDIADAVGIPMCFKRFHPKATFYVAELSGLLCRHPDVVSHHCPKGINPQSSWLSIIAKARESGNEDFAIWTAIHCEALGDDSAHWIRIALEDLNDWIKACASERASCSIEEDDIEKIHTAMLSTCGAEAAESLQQWWQGLSGTA